MRLQLHAQIHEKAQINVSKNCGCYTSTTTAIAISMPLVIDLHAHKFVA